VLGHTIKQIHKYISEIQIQKPLYTYATYRSDMYPRRAHPQVLKVMAVNKEEPHPHKQLLLLPEVIITPHPELGGE
jgi:hypothetical protein